MFHRFPSFGALAFLIFMLAGAEGRAGYAPNEKLAVLPTRAGVNLPVLSVKPDLDPSAVVILFSGDDGVLDLTPSGIGSGTDNFVIRTRQLYATEGFVAVAVDVPSDHLGGIGDAYRTSEDEAQDIDAVIDWIHGMWAAPVWLIGTSRGTISAANVAARLGSSRLAGLVLTSSITRGKGATLYDVALGNIRIPTLFVHHREDACPAAPFAGVTPLLAAFTGISQRPLVPFDGGGPVQPDPCGGISYHGYAGIEGSAVESIAQFISVK